MHSYVLLFLLTIAHHFPQYVPKGGMGDGGWSKAHAGTQKFASLSFAGEIKSRRLILLLLVFLVECSGLRRCCSPKTICLINFERRQVAYCLALSGSKCLYNTDRSKFCGFADMSYT